uniref:SCP domain-containing protein n=1 Tax=Strongyloides venezuelensis TaxID=75913 RepID=A0A0K0FJ58_STRVS
MCIFYSNYYIRFVILSTLFFLYKALEGDARIGDNASLDLIQNDISLMNLINQESLVYSISGNSEIKYLKKRQSEKNKEQNKHKSAEIKNNRKQVKVKKSPARKLSGKRPPVPRPPMRKPGPRRTTARRPPARRTPPRRPPPRRTTARRPPNRRTPPRRPPPRRTTARRPPNRRTPPRRPPPRRTTARRPPARRTPPRRPPPRRTTLRRPPTRRTLRPPNKRPPTRKPIPKPNLQKRTTKIPSSGGKIRTTPKPPAQKPQVRKTTVKATTVRKPLLTRKIKPAAKSSSITTTEKPVTSTMKTAPIETIPIITTSTSTATTTTKHTTKPETTSRFDEYAYLKSQMISYVNDLRLKHQTEELTVNTTLANKAQKVADDIRNILVNIDNSIGWLLLFTGLGDDSNPSTAKSADTENIVYGRPDSKPAPEEFAQLVWNSTKDIGCGISYIDTEHIMVTICMFYPYRKIPVQ